MLNEKKDYILESLFSEIPLKPELFINELKNDEVKHKRALLVMKDNISEGKIYDIIL